MAPRFDTDRIIAENRLVDVVSKNVALKKDGKEWRGLCPFHAEKTPSFSVFTGRDGTERYHCFGCGAGGNVVDYVKEFAGVEFKEACEILGGARELVGSGKQREAAGRVEVVDPYAGWEPVVPVPSKAARIVPGRATPPMENPKRRDEQDYKPWVAKPSLVHAYRDAERRLLFYVLRVDKPEGGKLTPCVMWCRTPQGDEAWALMRPDLPYQLYGLDRLAGNEKPVLVVEGEKSADAGHAMLEHWAVVSWLGGTNGWDKADWSPLAGRRVTVMPDNDEVGEKTAREICAALAGIAAEVRIIARDKEKPKGWDIADAAADSWDAAAFAAWAKPRVSVWGAPEPKLEPPQHEEPLPELPPSEEPPAVFDDAPFRILGHNRGLYFYLPAGTQQMVELTPSAHTKLNLLSLADASYWQEFFGLGDKGDKVYEAAANAMMRGAQRVGPFDSEVVRGRGAWSDEGRAVLHCGDKVIVDGQVFDPSKVPSRYIYERSFPLHLEDSDIASSAEANQLVKICKSLSWERELSADLLAGWCVVAPVSGILKWRPHIWVTGPAGSGKTTVMEDIISRILGRIGLKVEGKTTEAAIRQLLNRDARPLVFDEAESEDPKAAMNMRGVLDLARLASSGGQVVKGSKDGKHPMVFSVRSCFCFSAINPSVREYADETRVTKLALRKNTAPDAAEHYKKLQRAIFDTCTPQYSSRLLARTVRYMHVLLQNIEVFTEAAALVLGDRRAADQIGTLLAGCYLLHSPKVIDREAAVEWIRSKDWTMHTAIESARDEERLVSHLATERVRVKRSGGMEEISIGALIFEARTSLSGSTEEKQLRELGIMVENDGLHIIIANDARPLRDILGKTPWGADWSRPLRQLEGASVTENSKYFAPGIKCRGTRVPIRYFIDDGKAQKSAKNEDL